MARRRAGIAGAPFVTVPAPVTRLPQGGGAAALRERATAAWRLGWRWKGRLFFAFVDQGAYSLANFLLTIVYASWLPLDTFGRYVLVWTASLFIETIQTALIVDSLPAIFSRHGRHGRARLDIPALWVVIGYGAVTSLGLLAAAAIVGLWRPAYVGALLALAAVNPLQRLYLLFRRLAYIRDRQDVAAAMALAYSTVSLAGAFVLMRAQTLSLTAAIGLWGIGTLAAVTVALARGIGRLRAARAIQVVWLAREIWRSGRWLSAAAVVTWITNWAIFPIVAATGGAGAAGTIRALQNLLTPVVQFNAALHLAVLPRVADKVADVGDHYGRRFARRGTALFAAIATGYCAIVLASAPVILPAVYGKPEIAAAAHLLWPLAAAIAFDALRQASTIALLANRRTRIVFVARWIALAVFLASGLTLNALIGLGGILWAAAAASAAGAAILLAAALSAGRPEPR
jgi:O-antigen/teichoic acid export membrane protein